MTDAGCEHFKVYLVSMLAAWDVELIDFGVSLIGGFEKYRRELVNRQWRLRWKETEKNHKKFAIAKEF